jgi:hypothetical protein
MARNPFTRSSFKFSRLVSNEIKSVTTKRRADYSTEVVPFSLLSSFLSWNNVKVPSRMRTAHAVSSCRDARPFTTFQNKTNLKEV